MKLYRIFENILLSLLQWIWKSFISIHEKKNIRKKKELYSQVVLTDEQKKQIDSFYLENYGKKIPYKWHRLYTSYTGKFDYRYLPEYIFTTEFEAISNKRVAALAYENKNMLQTLFGNTADNIRVPDTYVKCVNGVYFNSDNSVISKQAAADRIVKLSSGNETDVVGKVTVDTNSGRDVHIYRLSDGIDIESGVSAKQIIDSLGNNFVLQERIVPHKALSTLYPHSINTFRVISYFVENEIHVAPIILRIGRGGNTLDNAHAGGIFIGVNDDGRLTEEAFTEYQERFKIHPDTNVVFKDYQIPFAAELKEAAVKLHSKIPLFLLAGWDLAVDKNGNIVVIEVNLHSQGTWIAQMAPGKALFGDDTGYMLRMLRDRKKRKNA